MPAGRHGAPAGVPNRIRHASVCVRQRVRRNGCVLTDTLLRYGKPSDSPPPRLCASCLHVIVRVTTCGHGHERPLYRESVGRGGGEAAAVTILELLSQSVPPHFSLYSTHRVFACKRGILSASRARAHAVPSSVCQGYSVAVFLYRFSHLLPPSSSFDRIGVNLTSAAGSHYGAVQISSVVPWVLEIFTVLLSGRSGQGGLHGPSQCRSTRASCSTAYVLSNPTETMWSDWAEGSGCASTPKSSEPKSIFPSDVPTRATDAERTSL